MGMGALVKGSQSQPGEGAGPSTQPGAASGAEVTKTNSGPRWGSIFGLGALTGEGAAERARRKSIVEEKEEQDDKHIWFKLEGVDRRLTKNDFIKLVQQMDPQKRLEVIDTSSASNAVKSLARMDPPKSAKKVEQAAESAAGPEEHGRDSYDGEASSSQQTRSTSRSPSSSGPRKADPGDDQPSSSIPETAAERRRRMSVLQNVDDDAAETPAERRRREAALGVGSSGQTADDSDDDDTPRVPPARRGIRFADNIERGRR